MTACLLAGLGVGMSTGDWWLALAATAAAYAVAPWNPAWFRQGDA